MVENIHHGVHLDASKTLRNLNVSVLETMGRVYDRGVAKGVFRPGLDQIDIHMTISALSFFNVSNRFTFSKIFNRDIADPKVAQPPAPHRHRHRVAVHARSASGVGRVSDQRNPPPHSRTRRREVAGYAGGNPPYGWTTSIRQTGVPASASCPSLTSTSRSVPAAGASMSVAVFSVSISRAPHPPRRSRPAACASA